MASKFWVSLYYRQHMLWRSVGSTILIVDSVRNYFTYISISSQSHSFSIVSPYSLQVSSCSALRFFFAIRIHALVDFILRKFGIAFGLCDVCHIVADLLTLVSASGQKQDGEAETGKHMNSMPTWHQMFGLLYRDRQDLASLRSMV